MINIKVAFLIHTYLRAIYHGNDSNVFPLGESYVASN